RLVESNQRAAARARPSPSRKTRVVVTTCQGEDTRSIFVFRSVALVRQPCLEHQNVPQRILDVRFAAQVLRPHLSYRPGAEIAFVMQASFADQVFSPVPQRSAQPASQRDAEPHLGAFDQ